MPETLLFIPDISGFTKFVNQTEVQHGQHVISELLEVLIDSNNLGLILSEIEGDALLFYKQNDLPTRDQIATLARQMFLNFHQHLKNYQNHRICQCGACRTAGNLTLKFVVHSGIVDFIKVKDRLKPYGTDVILAHRLLKNPIENREYLLLSENVVQPDEDIESLNSNWLKFHSGKVSYDSIGEIKYYYGSLSTLHAEVPEPKAVTNPQKKARPIISSITIDRPAYQVFESIIDLEQRMNWNKFANKIEYNGELNQVGTRHVCVFDTHTLEFETVTNDFGKDSLVYGEKVLTLPFFAKEATVYFIVSPQVSGSEVKVAVHYEFKPVWSLFMSPFFRFDTQKKNQAILKNLKAYCESQLTPEGIEENQKDQKRSYEF